jgi:hypothetical protein
MGQDVVQLAGDPRPLLGRRRLGLGIARGLQLGQQQLRTVLALPGLLEQVRRHSQQPAQEQFRENHLRRAPAQRAGEA